LRVGVKRTSSLHAFLDFLPLLARVGMLSSSCFAVTPIQVKRLEFKDNKKRGTHCNLHTSILSGCDWLNPNDIHKRQSVEVDFERSRSSEGDKNVQTSDPSSTAFSTWASSSLLSS
jgi:hypothetical protein